MLWKICLYPPQNNMCLFLAFPSLMGFGTVSNDGALTELPVMSESESLTTVKWHSFHAIWQCSGALGVQQD